jgi:phage-related protein
MTKDQDHIITLLFIKYGGFEAVVDTWLYSDSRLTAEEKDAVDAWLSSNQTKPNKLQFLKNGDYPYLAAEISINIDEKG